MDFLKIFILASTLCVASVNASVIEFDFESSPFGTGVSSSSLTHTESGLTLTITAFTLTNNGSGAISASNLLNAAGFGVYDDDGTFGDGLGVFNNLASDGKRLDGSSSNFRDEGLLFSFSQDVNLERLNFGSWDDNEDDFNLNIGFNGSSFGTNLLTDFGSFDTDALVSLVDGSSNDKFHFQNITGNNFLVWADGDTDKFLIDDIKVSIAIPEPSILALMGFGLAGLVFSRRRKNIA